jgi:lipopolysaccharide transport system ATP-binding protein
MIMVERLGKRYRIRRQGQQYVALRDVLASTLSRPAYWFRRRGYPEIRRRTEDFWALKDVSFEVTQGEVVGIIGRNGAGKSTLLKLLSRITEPTEGRITLEGRVASLLEVGIGFHPELTGRENIFLNGAILGMRRAEITRRFDAIVAFAEVERFLDTPVKRYSSGMYVRLAFAVAAHMEPDILIVDEVLAVGDAEFQKKCLGKMQEVSHTGRTVLFVSHQMAAIQNLCHTGILLAEGRIVQAGPVHDVVKRYLTESGRLAALSLDDRPDREGSGALRFRSVSCRDEAGQPIGSFTCGSPAMIELVVAIPGPRRLRAVRVAIGIDNDVGERIIVLSTHLAGADFPDLPADTERVRVRIPRITLCPGHYGFTLFASVNGEVADWVKNAGTFDVEGGDFYGSGQMPPQGQGFMVMDHVFEIQTAQAALP